MDTQAPMFDTEDIDAVVVEVQEEAHPMLTVEVCRELNIEGFDEKLKQPCIAKTGGKADLLELLQDAVEKMCLSIMIIKLTVLKEREYTLRTLTIDFLIAIDM